MLIALVTNSVVHNFLTSLFAPLKGFKKTLSLASIIIIKFPSFDFTNPESC